MRNSYWTRKGQKRREKTRAERYEKLVKKSQPSPLRASGDYLMLIVHEAIASV